MQLAFFTLARVAETIDTINEQATTTNKRFAISVGDIFTCKRVVCNLAYHLPNKQQVKNE